VTDEETVPAAVVREFLSAYDAWAKSPVRTRAQEILHQARFDEALSALRAAGRPAVVYVAHGEGSS